jgi:hypothetical protein
MTGLTDCITDSVWEDTWIHWFCLVDTAYQTLEAHYGQWRRTGPAPSFHDSEVITVALIIDTWFHGHEALGLAFLRQYHPTLFPRLPQPGHFNARRTVLGPLMEQIRQLLVRHTELIPADEPHRLIDSAPIPVATYRRASSVQTVVGPEYFSVMVTRAAKLFGLRVTVTVTPNGVIDQWCLAPAAVHDSQVMPVLLDDQADQVVLGDGAYHNPTAEPVLAAHDIQVFAPPRCNAKAVTPWPQALRRQFSAIRQRVETVFSTLTTVFDLQRPRARSLKGIVSRISTRILAYTLCFLTPTEASHTCIQTPN